MESLTRMTKSSSIEFRSWIVFGLCAAFSLGLFGLGFAGESLITDYSGKYSATGAFTGSETDSSVVAQSETDYVLDESPAEPKKPKALEVPSNQKAENVSGAEDIVLSDAKYTEADYLYYPVNKKYAFPSGYTPGGLVSLSDYDIKRIGGAKFYLRSSVAVALEKMLVEMQSEGYSIAVRSAYRSESTQKSTFSSWVKKEQAKGYSYNEAVARASEYSARPRHSEHQLGTTVDLTLPRLDNAFTQKMWSTPEVAWLMQNAHRYGFVVSYPQNRQSITGYSPEPWHIRYIGEDYATAIYNQGYLNSSSSLCVATFLINR